MDGEALGVRKLACALAAACSTRQAKSQGGSKAALHGAFGAALPIAYCPLLFFSCSLRQEI